MKRSLILGAGSLCLIVGFVGVVVYGPVWFSLYIIGSAIFCFGMNEKKPKQENIATFTTSKWLEYFNLMNYHDLVWFMTYVDAPNMPKITTGSEYKSWLRCQSVNSYAKYKFSQFLEWEDNPKLEFAMYQGSLPGSEKMRKIYKCADGSTYTVNV